MFGKWGFFQKKLDIACHIQNIFLTATDRVANSVRLPIGVRGNTRRASLPCGESRCVTRCDKTLSNAGEEWRKFILILLKGAVILRLSVMIQMRVFQDGSEKFRLEITAIQPPCQVRRKCDDKDVFFSFSYIHTLSIFFSPTHLEGS